MKTRCSPPDLIPISDIPTFKNSSEIPYDATCVTLNFNTEFSCNTYVRKTDKLTKKISNKRIKFRHLTDRCHCE